MPISSSRNRLTQAAVRRAEDEDQNGVRSGARSVPVCNVENQGTSKQIRGTSVTQSPVAAGHSGVAKTESGPGRPQGKVKLPLITRIQNRLFGRSHSHASAVDKSRDTQPSPGTPRRRRFRHHKHHKSASPEFALRKIRFFAAPPEPTPLTLCFSHPGVELTHGDIIRGIQAMHTVSVDDIESIQFVDMNVILGTAGVSNRWLIKVKDYDTRYLLLCDGFKINDEYVILRKYDDVNMEDYREYLRRRDTLASEEHRDAVQRLLAM
ncbi:uncharacterized protein LOC110989304 [Acanthaster planci]|uniref:Uncharacterized protein LOC110989304 n=1 Tax=Acanthaster planci TaxID=133434 RepID=A0A8B8A0C6_ACAPL|nr:uncharacterized protein LOC110989304 [Acanthaster planci]